MSLRVRSLRLVVAAQGALLAVPAALGYLVATPAWAWAWLAGGGVAVLATLVTLAGRAYSQRSGNGVGVALDLGIVALRFVGVVALLAGALWWLGGAAIFAVVVSWLAIYLLGTFGIARAHRAVASS